MVALIVILLVAPGLLLLIFIVGYLARGRDRTAGKMIQTPSMCGKLFMLAIISVCSAAQSAGPSPTTAPAVVSGTVKLSDCVPLDDLQIDNRQANFTDKLSAPDTAAEIYFGELDLFDGDDPDAKPIDAVPIIATRQDGKWVAVPLLGEGTKKAGWRYVASGPAPREIWAAVDAVTDEHRASFVLVHSTDGGATFELRVFHKPCKQAEFFDFSMNHDGHGRATVALDSDTGRHKAGLYHYETTDDGKTWTNLPRLEPDAMIRAAPVPDEEQPDAPTNEPRTSAAPKFQPPDYARR